MCGWSSIRQLFTTMKSVAPALCCKLPERPNRHCSARPSTIRLTGLPLAVERNGYRMIMWDPGEPPDRDPKLYAAKVLAQVRPGSIILVHPMYSANATERAAIPLILDGLSRRGFRTVTVSELLAAKAPSL